MNEGIDSDPPFSLLFCTLCCVALRTRVELLLHATRRAERAERVFPASDEGLLVAVQLDLERGLERKWREVHRHLRGAIFLHGCLAGKFEAGQEIPLIVLQRKVAGPFGLSILNRKLAHPGMRILQDFVLIRDPVSSEVPFLAATFFFEECVSLGAEDE